MGEHIVDGEFQSDKYPTTPRGKVPLSIKDPTAQDLLWQYAQRRRAVDAAFADDLEACLTAAGYVHQIALDTAALLPARKEWDGEAHDSGEQPESGDYVDGWNDALDAAQYSEALRKTPAELVAAREVIAEARATIASHHQGIAPIDGLRSAMQRFDMRPADQPSARVPPPTPPAPPPPALSRPLDPALSTWAARGRLEATTLADLRDGDLSLLRELRADASEPETGHGDDCWTCSRKRRLIALLDRLIAGARP